MSTYLNQFNSDSRIKRNENSIQLYPYILYKTPNLREYYTKMQKLRITQKNLVYLIGFTKDLAFNETLLSSFEYLGQYGHILKLKVNKNKIYNTNNPNGPSYSCHVTYSSPSESSLAILSLDNIIFENHIFKASYGTTKYCSNFLYGTVCMNKDCLYLHSLANDNDIINRDEMNSNKQIFANQHIIAIELSGIFTNKKIENYLKNEIKNKRTIFPNASNVYNKDIVKEYYERNKDKIIKINKNKKIYSIMGLNNLYKRQEKSRFDFASNTIINNENDVSDVPLEISNFISKNIKRSILFKKEKDEISEYYFSIKKSNEAEDRWRSLVNTLEMYNSFNNCNNSIKKYENENIIVVSKFNSY
jgi:CCR4-NOT transcription complex subunit 4